MTTPTENLDAQMAELAEEGIETAEQFAKYLNEKNANNGGLFKLVEDGEHWAKFSNIHTARELAVMLDMSSFSDCYKDRHHFRPRNWSYDDAMLWMGLREFFHGDEPEIEDDVGFGSLPEYEITPDCDFSFR